MRQTPVHDAIVERWGAEIGSGRQAPGSRIIMDQAIVAFGASRSAVREAARVLESLGMVESRQRVGITVLPPESWSPYDARVLRWRLTGPDRIELLHSLNELRAAVEPAAARLAAERATPDQCARLAAAVMGMASTSRAANADDYLAHDAEFHTVLLQASGNVMLANLNKVVYAVLEGRTRNDLMPAVADAEALSLHGEVAVAVQSKDGDAAERAMRAIVEESDHAVLALDATRDAAHDL